MPRRSITKSTNIYWLYDTRPEKVVLYGDLGEPFYCGKTMHSPDARLASHQRDARRLSRPVHAYIRDCGEHVRIRIMEVVPCGADWAGREKHWIATLRFLYPDVCNISAGGQGAPGLIMSAQSRAKISSSKTGKKREPFSNEWRAALSVAAQNRPVKAIKQSVACKHCATGFVVSLSRLKRGRGRFCSQTCHYADRSQ